MKKLWLLLLLVNMAVYSMSADTTLIIVEVGMVTDSKGIHMPNLNYDMLYTVYSSTSLLNKDETRALCFLSVYNNWVLPVKTAFFLAGTPIIDSLIPYYGDYPDCIEVMNNITNPIPPTFSNE